MGDQPEPEGEKEEEEKDTVEAEAKPNEGTTEPVEEEGTTERRSDVVCYLPVTYP